MMTIIYTFLFGFSAFGFSKGYKETEAVMNKVRDDSEDSGFLWVLMSLGIAWLSIIALTAYARVKLNLSLHFAILIVSMKLPALLMGISFFEGRKYSRKIYWVDKLDQVANMTLCGFALYSYGVEFFRDV
jgi:hypothetical protein